MIDLAPLVTRLSELAARIAGKPDVRWGVVTGAEPLTIRLDADTVPLLGRPDTLVAGLQAGDRVQVMIQNRRATVIGRGGGRLGHNYAGMIQYTANGTFEKGDYPGIRAIKVRLVGGGGGGGNAVATGSANNSVGTGGGGGGYAESFIVDMESIPSSVAVTVGAGGSATNAGGTSSFGDRVVATGGGGGIGKANDPYASYVSGGSGGVGTAGDLQIAGEGGTSGSCYSNLASGGGGGSSMLGGGARSTGTGAGNGGTVGNPGGQYGGGGSGASNNGAAGAKSGSAGAQGIVIVEIYG